MKRTFLLLWALVAVGCASTNKLVLDSTVRPPTDSVEIFRADPPSRPTKNIAQYSFLGPRQDEIRAMKFFASEARKAGAHGVLIEWPPQGDRSTFGLAGGNGGFIGESVNYVFRAAAFVYTEPSTVSSSEEKGFRGVLSGKEEPVKKAGSARF